MAPTNSNSHSDSSVATGASDVKSQLNPVWWIRPVPLLLAATGSSALAAYLLPQNVYFHEWDETKYFDSPYFDWCILGLVAVILGISVGAVTVRSRRLPVRLTQVMPRSELRSAFRLFFRLTMLGYLIWAAVALSRGVGPHLIFSVLERSQSAASILKEKLAPVSGVTTMSQFGIVAAVLGAYLLFVHHDRSIRPSMIALVLVSALRAFFNSERLAIIEVVVPIVVVWVGALRASGRVSRRGRRYMIIVPILAPLILLSYFVGTEYFRSYAYYQKQGAAGPVSFSVARLEAYYATAFNNGAILDQQLEPGHRTPYLTITAFWRAPIVSQLIPFQDVAGYDSGAAEKAILTEVANPQYNNPGGLMSAEIDWGYGGGLVFLLITGLAIGALWRSWRALRPLGLLLYPVVVVALLDLPREFYLGASRAFPAVVGLICVAVFLRNRRLACASTSNHLNVSLTLRDEPGAVRASHGTTASRRQLAVHGKAGD